ncbi:MAG TPA: AAA family ATPase, partial [Phycisphaerae bacterium]|nr:AAA family ATPase [Phycisphaerae bacterium]
MYCSHFGLHRPPFNNTPDPSFYYSTPDHEEALATLQYATLNRKGFVLVTGEVGAGKTLIGRMFIRQVDRQASTAVITHTQLNPRQLLGAICTEFELDVPPDATHLQLVDRLQQYLLDQFARNRFVVVLLDEAQNLPDESFEALRMLGNLEADDAKLLQVCILGQPELRQRFQSERMRQLDQRLFRRFHLTGLTPQQTIEYIQCRLQVAGCSRSDLFVPTAFDLIYEGSQGIPRLINRICDNALLAAYAQGSHQVDENMVQQVLDQEGLSREEIASPADAETEARIEHIYGSRPELVEADCADRMAAAPEASGEAVAKAVSTLSHAVAGTSACVAGSIEAQSRIQTEWSDRLDRTLAELSQQLQARASGTEVNDLRQKTDRLSERLDGLREAHAEGLRALQGEVERKLEAIQTELAAESSRLNLDSLRDETTQRTEAVRTELYRELEQRIRDLTERLESIRELQVTAGTTLQRELEDRLAAIHAEVEAVPHGEASVDKLASLREQTAQQIQAIQAESQARLTRSHQELDERIKQVLETVARLKTDHEIEVRNRAESITDQAVAIEDIYTSVGRHEDEIRHLSKTAAKRFEALTRGLNELREAAPHTGAMEQLRGEHAAFAREVLDRFAEKAAELDELKAMLDRQASMSGEQASTLAELSSRLERETKQLRRVRRHLLATHSAMKERFAALDGQYAARDELENLRQHQAAQAHEFLEQLQKARESVESLVADLTERFRCTHQRLDQLAAASETEGSDLADLRRAHAEDVANLLRQLEDQRRISQEQFEQTVAQWQAAQQEIESLRSAALDEAALAELRDRQQEQAEQILRLMDEQRRNLETLISAADQRYDELLARI